MLLSHLFHFSVQVVEIEICQADGTMNTLKKAQEERKEFFAKLSAEQLLQVGQLELSMDRKRTHRTTKPNEQVRNGQEQNSIVKISTQLHTFQNFVVFLFCFNLFLRRPGEC